MLHFAAPTQPFYVSNPQPLGVEDLLSSLTRLAYNEELARREQLAAHLKRKRVDSQHRNETVVKHFENDNLYQIQLIKDTPCKQNFQSYQIQYFKKGGETLIRIESKVDGFSRNYKFKSSKINEQEIDYKIIKNKIMVINIPKRVEEFEAENLFDLVQRKYQAEYERRAAEEEAHQREIALRKEKQRQLQIQKERERQLKLQREKERQLQIQREQERQRLLQREIAIQRQKEAEKQRFLKEQLERQENLELFLNAFVQGFGAAPELQKDKTFNGFQRIPIFDFLPQDAQEHEPEAAESETDQSSTEESDDDYSPPTPSLSDLEEEEEDALDPEDGDLSELLTETIKKVSSKSDSSDIDSDAVYDESDISDNESTGKKRQCRSPSIEEVEDEEFLRWTST